MVGADAELAGGVSSTGSAARGPAKADFGGLARRGALSLGGAVVSAVANFVLIVVVTRSFDRDTAGFLFTGTSLFVVAEALCALGTATGMVYFIARYRALGSHRAARSIIVLGAGPVVAVSAVVAIVTFVFAPQVASQIVGPGTTDEAVRFLRVLMAFLPFAAAYDLCIAASQGFHTMNPTVILEKVSRPVVQLLGVAVAGLLGAAWLLPVAWAAPYAAGAFIVAWWLRRIVRADLAASGNRAGDVDGPSRREFWSYTAPRGIASAAQLSLQRLDIIMIAFMLGAAPAALYTAATRFLVVGQLGSQAIALAVQPKYAELIAHDDRHVTERVYRTTTAWIMSVTWPIHLLVAVSAPIILKVFGAGYDEAWPVTVLLALTMLFATSCGMVTMLLVMAGKTSWNLINVLVALVANVSLNVLLIPVWGILGAAVAWSVSLILANALPLAQVGRLLGVNPFGRESLAVAVSCLACFALVPGLAWLGGGELWILVALSALGTVGYAYGLWRLRRLLALEELTASLRRRGARTKGTSSLSSN